MNPITLKLQAEPLVRMALQEDITSEDVSTASVMPGPARGEVHLIAKQDGVVCGLDVFALAFTLLDPTTEVAFTVAEGDEVTAGQELAVVTADVAALLSGERVALNYLQRMSGIATYTRRMAALFAGTHTQLVDTRKTTPLKDNHIDAAGGVAQAIAAARAHAPFVRKIEVEVETLDMVREAVEAGADIIMLDNMDVATMREAIALIDGRAEVEVSGNVTAENAARLVDLGVDYVSSGALTHSAPILDLSLKHLRVIG